MRTRALLDVKTNKRQSHVGMKEVERSDLHLLLLHDLPETVELLLDGNSEHVAH